MADLRIPTNVPVSPGTRRDLASDRDDAVRAAQRAFFEAAMKGTANLPTPVRTAPAPQAAAPSRVDKFEFDPNNPPQEVLRPGSLVDIRV